MKTNGKGRDEKLKIKRIKLIAISKMPHCVFFEFCELKLLRIFYWELNISLSLSVQSLG